MIPQYPSTVIFPSLCFREWWESKNKYWFVCGGFLYTALLRSPSSVMCTAQPRKARHFPLTFLQSDSPQHWCVRGNFTSWFFVFSFNQGVSQRANRGHIWSCLRLIPENNVLVCSTFPSGLDCYNHMNACEEWPQWLKLQSVISESGLPLFMFPNSSWVKLLAVLWLCNSTPS